MKKVRILFLLPLLALGGCATAPGLVPASGNSLRAGVFEEVSDSTEVSKSNAILRVSTTLKTHNEDSFSPSDSHGTADYKVLLNLDGQALLLDGHFYSERKKPAHDTDPEGGHGVRYRFGKALRLNAGTHKLVVSLPEDRISVEKKITLKNGTVNTVVLEPIYRKTTDLKRPRNHREKSFREGVWSLRVIVNGQEI